MFGPGFSTEVGFFRGFGLFSWIHEEVRVLSWIFDPRGVFSWIWTFSVDTRKSEGFVIEDPRKNEFFVVDFRRRWGFSVDLDFFRGSTKQ